MLGALSLLVFASLAAPPLDPGTWIATEGPAGEKPIQGIVTGGDGAVYAAGQGVVYRLTPGETWTALGRYTPRIDYDLFDGIQARGDFSPAFLEATRVELNQALVPHLGLDDERPEDMQIMDIVLAVFDSYTTEPDPAPESVYAVHRLAWAKDGAWLATGGGLFKATAQGVQGPLVDQAPVLDVIESRNEVLLLTPSGIRQLKDGRAEPWRQFITQRLARVDGRAAFIAEGTSWWDDGQVGPRRISPPTGVPRQIASGGTLLFVATDLAVYRRQGEAWTLCARLPEAPQRLISNDAILLAVGESAIYATDMECTRWTQHRAPWLNEMRFYDAAISRAGVWGATSDGVFLLGPRDHDLMTATAVEGFERRLKTLPSWPEAFAAAQKTMVLDRASSGFGRRPLWRMLLPQVLLTVGTWPGRVERDPTFLGGTPQVTTLPRDYFAVGATWQIDFGGLTQLFAGADQVGNQNNVDAPDGLAAPVDAAPLDDGATDDTTAEEALATELTSAFAGQVLVEADISPGDVVQVNVSGRDIAANDRTRIRRDRYSLYMNLRRLYRERLRLMYRLFLNQANVDPRDLLRLQALDARIDAYTGGVWSRALRSAR